MRSVYGLTDDEKKTITELYQQGFGAPAISLKTGIKTGRISYYIGKYVGSRTCSEAAKKYYCNENFFETIDTEEKAYWLGFLYADGYVTKSGPYNCGTVGIALKNDDKKHLEKFACSLGANNPIYTYKVSSGYSPNTVYSRITIKSSKLFNDAIKQGIFEHKTKILQAPLHVPAELKHHFIRGYFDGDGSITRCLKRRRPGKPKNGLDYSIKIEGVVPILDYIKKFIHENNIATIRRYYQRRKNGSTYNIDFAGNQQVLKFYKALYKESHIWLDRKYDRFQELCNYLHSRVIPEGIA